MIIDHLGLAVRDIEKGIKQWKESFGYRQKTRVVHNTRQKVKVVFMEKENSLLIKLIEPSDETSPIAAFTRKGGGLHHICFKCDDIESGMTKLKEKGNMILVKPQPGEAFENEKIAFALGKNNLAIELIDTDKKAQLID